MAMPLPEGYAIAYPNGNVDKRIKGIRWAVNGRLMAKVT